MKSSFTWLVKFATLSVRASTAALWQETTMKAKPMVVYVLVVLLVVVCGALMRMVYAQEQPSNALQVWEIVQKPFGQRGSRQFADRTVFVYKFQSGAKMRCLATLVTRGIDDRAVSAVASLGEVPCGE